MNEEIIKQLIDAGIVGVLGVTEDGRVQLELFIEENKMSFGELQQIQEGMNLVSDVLVDFFNRIN